MEEIYDAEGNHIGGIPLTTKQRTLLEAGEEVTIMFHTPQLMHGLLGKRAGQLRIKREGERTITASVTMLKEFQALRDSIEVIQRQAREEQEKREIK